MLGILSADNLFEIARQCNYVSLLMFSRTAEGVRKYAPVNVLPLDELLLGVLDQGAIELCEYYRVARLKPVWEYLIRRNYVLAHIGRHVAVEVVRWIIVMLRPDPLAIDIIIEFAIESRSLVELRGFRTRHQGNVIHIYQSVCQRSPAEGYEIKRIFGVDSTEVNDRHACRWFFRHGGRGSMPFWTKMHQHIPSTIHEAISFRESKFFIAHARSLSSVDKNECFEVALREGNGEVAEYLLRCGATVHVPVDYDYEFTTAFTSSGIAEVLGYGHPAIVGGALKCTMMLSGEHRRLCHRLATAGCRLSRESAECLYGKYIVSLAEPRRWPHLTLDYLFRAVMESLAVPTDYVDVGAVRTYLGLVSDKFGGQIRDSVLRIPKLLGTELSQRSLSIRVCRLVAVAGSFESYRGCLRGKIDPNHHRLDHAAQTALKTSLFLAGAK